MAGRIGNETTQAWLERLLADGATDAQINAVTKILEKEGCPNQNFIFDCLTFSFVPFRGDIILRRKRPTRR
jgi:hypothetical protein